MIVINEATGNVVQSLHQWPPMDQKSGRVWVPDADEAEKSSAEVPEQQYSSAVRRPAPVPAMISLGGICGIAGYTERVSDTVHWLRQWPPMGTQGS